jgi:ABC-2 type transport system permease protein
MMLRGLWKLTWIEIKIFLREPMGASGRSFAPGSGVPVAGPVRRPAGSRAIASAEAIFCASGLPVLAVDSDCLSAPCCRW